MKFKNLLVAAIVVMAGLTGLIANAAGPAYPINTPTYIPSAISQPQAFTAPGNYTYQVSGISTVSVRVTGTCTNLAATLQGSNDGTNFTNLPLVRVTDGVPASSITAAGFWRASTAGFSAARVNISALSASCTVAMAGTQAPLLTLNSPVAGDPCLNGAVAKTTVAVAQGSSTTTKVVDVSGTTAIYVCSYQVTAGGTNPTLTWKSGTNTSTDCDTNAVSLSGAMVPSATIGILQADGPGTVLSTVGARQLCLTTGATTSVQGFLSYVRQ